MDKPINKITAADLPKSGSVLLFGLGCTDDFRPPCVAGVAPDAVVTLRPMTLQERRRHSSIASNCGRWEAHNSEVSRRAIELGESLKFADYSDDMAKMEDILLGCVTAVRGIATASGEPASLDDFKGGAPEEMKAEIFGRILEISGISRSEERNLGC